MFLLQTLDKNLVKQCNLLRQFAQNRKQRLGHLPQDLRHIELLAHERFRAASVHATSLGFAKPTDHVHDTRPMLDQNVPCFHQAQQLLGLVIPQLHRDQQATIRPRQFRQHLCVIPAVLPTAVSDHAQLAGIAHQYLVAQPNR